jgi:hypothetical protein
MTTTATIRDLPKGEYIRRKHDAATTYIRGEYDRSSKRYELRDCDDMNRSIWLKGDTLVTVGFTY